MILYILLSASCRASLVSHRHSVHRNKNMSPYGAMSFSAPVERAAPGLLLLHWDGRSGDRDNAGSIDFSHHFYCAT